MTTFNKEYNVSFRTFDVFGNAEPAHRYTAYEYLDSLNTSRESWYYLPNGMKTWHVNDLINPAELADGDELICTSELHCGKYSLIMKEYLTDWNAEEQMFLNGGAEPLGWDYAD